MAWPAVRSSLDTQSDGGRNRHAPRSPSCVPGSASRVPTRACGRTGSRPATARSISRWSCAIAPGRSPRGSSGRSIGSPVASSAGTRSGSPARSSASAASWSPRSTTSSRSTTGELDPADFLPAAYRDAQELEGFLEHLTREVHDAPLRSVVERVLFTEPVAAEFRRAPCTRAGHHSYVGGTDRAHRRGRHPRRRGLPAPPPARLRPADGGGSRCTTSARRASSATGRSSGSPRRGV